MTMEPQLAEILGRLDERTKAMHEDVSEVKKSCADLTERLNETRDMAVEAKSGAKKSGALTGAGTSGGLVAVVELVKRLVGDS